MFRIKHIAVKEVRHILRDPRSLIIALLMPILMTLLYGYAINLDIKNIRLAIFDFDQTLESRELAGRFYNSGYFIKPPEAPDLNDPERILRSGHASAILVIQWGFSNAIATQQNFQVGLTIDGADANTANAISAYSKVILNQYLQDQLPPGVQLPGVIISPQILYNPDLKSSHFFVPGLIAVILMMISALLTSITIAREKETGTMEQLLTCPISPREIIIGKVIPYIGLAFLDGVLILIFGVFHFGVPFVGSISLLVLFGFVYITAALSIGILISTLVKTQQLAMSYAQLVTVLPSVMLSGYIFDIKNMPVALQYLSRIIPARYFLVIIRGIMLKGSGLSVLWAESIFLVLLTVILLSIAVKRFHLKIG